MQRSDPKEYRAPDVVPGRCFPEKDAGGSVWKKRNVAENAVCGRPEKQCRLDKVMPVEENHGAKSRANAQSSQGSIHETLDDLPNR